MRGVCQCRLLKYDVSLRLSDMDAVVHAVKQQMRREGHAVVHTSPELVATAAAAAGSDAGGDACALQFCCFGHAGDKNLHLNIVAAAGAAGAADHLDRAQVRISPARNRSFAQVPGRSTAPPGPLFCPRAPRIAPCTRRCWPRAAA